MFFVGTFYLTRRCCYPEKVYKVESTIKCLKFLKSKSLQQHALKTTFQEPFRKKESKFCENLHLLIHITVNAKNLSASEKKNQE